MKILVIHGPNLNLLGQREPEVYGHQTLEDLNRSVIDYGRGMDVDVVCFQSNHEGEIIDKIHQVVADGVSGIVINSGGLTHTSVSLRDALTAVAVPVSEVHLSNIYAREDFRKHSYISPISVGIVSGFGVSGYNFALEGLVGFIRSR